MLTTGFGIAPPVFEQQKKEGEATNGLDPNDMRSIYMAMRMQALDNYQLMMLPPQALRNPDPNFVNTDGMSYEELLALQERIGFVNKGLSNQDIKAIPQVIYSNKT